MTHSELAKRTAKWLKGQGWKVAIHDGFRAYTSNGEEPDVIAWKDGVSILFECKVSRSDFLSDKKKSFRADPSKGMGDWRFYICPPDIIQAEDLPDRWGLVWALPKKMNKVHGWPKGNCNWHIKKPFKGCKDSENMMLVSALRRFEIRGQLDTIYEKLEV